MDPIIKVDQEIDPQTILNPDFITKRADNVVTCDGRFLYQLVRGNTIVMMNKKYIVTENPKLNSFPIKRWTVWRYLWYVVLLPYVEQL